MRDEFVEFEEVAGWLQHCNGLCKFDAETRAAELMGKKRWEMVNAEHNRNFETEWNS